MRIDNIIRNLLGIFLVRCGQLNRLLTLINAARSPNEALLKEREFCLSFNIVLYRMYIRRNLCKHCATPRQLYQSLLIAFVCCFLLRFPCASHVLSPRTRSDCDCLLLIAYCFAIALRRRLFSLVAIWWINQEQSMGRKMSQGALDAYVIRGTFCPALSLFSPSSPLKTGAAGFAFDYNYSVTVSALKHLWRHDDVAESARCTWLYECTPKWDSVCAYRLWEKVAIVDLAIASLRLCCTFPPAHRSHLTPPLLGTASCSFLAQLVAIFVHFFCSSSSCNALSVANVVR